MTRKSSYENKSNSEEDRQMLTRRQLTLNEAAIAMNLATVKLLHTPEPPREQTPVRVPVSAYVEQGIQQAEQHANSQRSAQENVIPAQAGIQTPNSAGSGVRVETPTGNGPVYTGTAEQVSDAQAAVEAAFAEIDYSDSGYIDAISSSEDSDSSEPEYATA